MNDPVTERAWGTERQKEVHSLLHYPVATTARSGLAEARIQ